MKYDFQKSSKIPILDCQGFPTLLLLKKRRFQCKSCQKVTVTETALVKKNCQISLPILGESLSTPYRKHDQYSHR
ncbi:transposase family protein [Streptococcus suis]|uniref:transposase family protein n=1 Tax=Streptococcus suis TaxID=1307 RepID=UPI003F93711F